MSLTREKDAALRIRGWDVFRRRGGIIPQPAGGRGVVLRRVAIAGVRGVRGVVEGVVPALPEAPALEGPDAETAARRRTVLEAVRAQAYSFMATNTTAGVAGTVVDSIEAVARVKDDGVLSEVAFGTSLVGANLVGIAFRTSGGATFFATTSALTSGALGTDTLVPDFFHLDPLANFSTVPNRYWKVAGGMPVLSGENIFVVLRLKGVQALRTIEVLGSMTVQSGVAYEPRARRPAAGVVDRDEVVAVRRAARPPPRLAYPEFGGPVAARQALIPPGWTVLDASRVRGPGVPVPSGGGLPAPPEPPVPGFVFLRWVSVLPSLSSSPQTPVQAQQSVVGLGGAPAPESGAGLVYVPSWIQGPGLPHGYLIPVPARGQRIRVAENQWFREPPLAGQPPSGNVTFLYGSDPVPPGALLSSPGRLITSDMIRGATLIWFRGEQMTREDASAILAAEAAARGG